MTPLITGLDYFGKHGVSLTADGGDILWEAKRNLTGAEAKWITANKPALLRELTVVRLDFETISPLDLTKVGTWVYLAHPETQALVLAWCVGTGEVQLWRPGDPIPAALIAAIETDSVVVSHGVFDRLVWNAKLVPLGWPEVSVERWSDTMGRCRAYRAPAKLEKAAERLELGWQKDPAGKVLIRRATEAAKGGRPLTHEELVAFDNYARTDLEVLRELDRVLPELSPQERAAYLLTETMNARGFPIDRKLVPGLWGLWQAEDARLTEEMLALVGLRSTQDKKLIAWLREHAVPAPGNLQAETLTAWLNTNPHADDLRRKVVQLRIEAANTSGSKLKTLLDCTADRDPFARGALVWHGAHTGRWSGTVFQPQNFPRIPKDMDVMTVLAGLLQKDGPVRGDSIPGMETCKPAVSRSVKARIAYCLRAVIKAPQGQHLIVVDFSQIESRVLCWLAGQEGMLAGYRRPAADKWDPYIATAKTLGSNDRQFGKLLVLAAGFGGSARMLLAKALSYDVQLTEDEAARAIAGWREANRDIVEFWQALYKTVRDVVESPAGTSRPLGNLYPQNLIIVSHEHDDTLRIRLPTGRSLIYHQPRIVPDEEFEWWYDLVYQQAGPGDWIEKRSWRGLLTENVVQAVAYDLMAAAMLRMHQANIQLIGTVHDEAIALAAAPQAEVILQQMQAIMQEPPDWARDLPLAAEGYHNDRYLKPPKLGSAEVGYTHECR
jgi:DNA polymerase